jgi:probable HAF family extracellular repeat protein
MSSYANAVSGDGLVVVGYADAPDTSNPHQSASVHRPVRWTLARGFEDLGTLLPQWSGWAYAANRDGSIVAGAANEGGDNVAVRWIACGGMQLIGPSTPQLDPQSFGYAISRDGLVVAGTYGSYAFRWSSPEGLLSLGTLIGPPYSGWSEGWGVSGDGLVVVGRSYWTSYTRAFRWSSASGMVSLGTLGPGWNEGSQATAANYDGSVVVGWSGSKAFRWTAASGMQDLGTLPGGTSSKAWAVNADGSVVVGESNASDGGTYPFRWTAEGGMVNLAEYLHSNGLAMGMWPDRATGVSDDGLTIVGRVHLGALHDEGWVMTLGVGPNTPGACCRGAICTAVVSTECAGPGNAFTGPGVACNVLGNQVAPCCKVDFNKSGGISVGDIFDFLNAWFAASPTARFSSQCGLAVRDIFDYLTAWFAGCP